jgi:hypothetical protein
MLQHPDAGDQFDAHGFGHIISLSYEHRMKRTIQAMARYVLK